jgi:methyl-accepting chemotaxis protein
VEQTAGSRQVLEALTHINGLTQGVKQNSSSMKEGGSIVLKEMGRLTAVSQDILDAVGEISREISGIDLSLSRTAELGKRNAVLAVRVADAKGRFKAE